MEFGASPSDLDLPPRNGARPRTSIGLPHVQLDQWPPAGIAGQLVELALKIPGARGRQSRMAFPTSLALCLDDDFAHGPPEAFIDNHEFCFLHSLPGASIHATLPREIREAAIRLGWAEQHPGVRAGIMPDTLVMLYAPRDAGELRIVFQLIAVSSCFAKGTLNESPKDSPVHGVLSWAG
jgi:hypothetical protein